VVGDILYLGDVLFSCLLGDWSIRGFRFTRGLLMGDSVYDARLLELGGLCDSKKSI